MRVGKDQQDTESQPQGSLGDVLTSLEFLQSIWCMSERLKIGVCHDQNCILERSPECCVGT